MVTYDSTGFGGAEFAMPVPGVQVGKRLTLDNLNERLTALEGVVQQLVEATYTPVIVSNTTNERPTTHLDSLNERISELEEQLADAERDRDFWMNEHELVIDEYERLRARIDDLLG